MHFGNIRWNHYKKSIRLWTPTFAYYNYKLHVIVWSPYVITLLPILVRVLMNICNYLQIVGLTGRSPRRLCRRCPSAKVRVHWFAYAVVRLSVRFAIKRLICDCICIGFQCLCPTVIYAKRFFVVSIAIVECSELNGLTVSNLY